MRIDVDRLGDEIAELAAHLDAATHRLLTLIRRFDEAGGWADQGALTCAHWLSWRIGLELQLRPEEAAVVRRALEAATERAWGAKDVPAGTSPASLGRADALVAVAEQYLAGGPSAAAPPVEVVVHVDATTLADADAGGALDDGTTLAPAATDRLLCDASGGGARSRRCCGARSASEIAAVAFRAARTARSTGTTSSPGPAAAPPRSRTCARSAGGITRTSTSTGFASSPTARVGSASSARTGARCRRRAMRGRCWSHRWRRYARGSGRPGSRSMPGPGFRAGTGGRRTMSMRSSVWFSRRRGRAREACGRGAASGGEVKLGRRLEGGHMAAWGLNERSFSC